ncbi:MAG: glycine zipper 2TM domain-containing protein [Blastomonas sp.]
MKSAILTAAAGLALAATPAMAAPLAPAHAPAATPVQSIEFETVAHGYDRYGDYDYRRAGYRDYQPGDYYRGDRHDRRGRYDRGDRYDQRYRGDRVSRNTRVWRGNDGRYYCKRDNGTTGLLIGGAIGAVIGNEVAGRGDKTLGAILGGLGGALLGREIDKDDYRCR